MQHISAYKCCDSICTFDHECHFDEVCKNGNCGVDETYKWQCTSGLFDKPEMACRKVKPHEGKSML